MEEIWKDITGFEGLYQVSDLGRIKSLDRITKNYHSGDRYEKGKYLKPGNSHSGYKLIVLHKNGISRTFRLHRIVAQHFIDNHNNKPQINHKDGIKSNNAISNLEWCTAKENISHAFKNGLRSGYDRAILSDADVIYIKTHYVRLKVTASYFARKFNVSESCIRHIISGKNWSRINITEP